MEFPQIADFHEDRGAVTQNLVRIVLVEIGEMIRIKLIVCLNYHGRLIGNR